MIAREHHLESFKANHEWRGCIKLKVALIVVRDIGIKDGGVCVSDKPHLSNLEEQDICTLIGLNYTHDNISGKPVRLYFCQDTFPPPATIEDGDQGLTFESLKSYIRMESLYSGSPVTCRGGKKNVNKVFGCRECSHHGPPTSKCQLKFSIHWDDVGYYIHLSESMQGRFASGCPYHTCHPIPGKCNNRVEQRNKRVEQRATLKKLVQKWI